jgi:hypothetical protein
MKTHFVIPAAAAAICLSSCATDPAVLEKKKTTSIGRFGVIHNTPVDGQAPAPPATAPEPAPEIAASTAPAPETVRVPEKKQLFQWNRKKEEAPAADAPAPIPASAPVQEVAAKPAPQKKQLFNWNPKKKPAEPAVASAPSEKPAPAAAAVEKSAPAPEKEYLFDTWFKKKERAEAPASQNTETAAAPYTGKKKNVSIGRFGVTYVDPEGAAASAPAVESAPTPEKKAKFSWFKRKNDTEGAPIAVQVDEKPAEKKEKSVPKPRIARSDEPVEFKERGKSGGLSGDIRLPDMLNLPEGKDLKSSGSGSNKTGKEGAVISRPPVEEKKD